MGNKGGKDAKALSDKEIELLVNNTGMTKSEVVNWHKQFLTEYSDGSIDEKEFIALYKKLYKTGDPTKFAKFAFVAFDNDHNKKINFQEFVLSTAFVLHKESKDEEKRRRLELAFDIFDINDDGKIDAKELKKLYEALMELHSEKKEKADTKVKEILAKYDLDGNKYLVKTEFVNAMAHDNIFNYFS